MLTYNRTLPVVAEPDVLVCGAGCAGLGAAVAAARAGARTLVVERMGFAGGYLTAVIGGGFDGLVDSRMVLPRVAQGVGRGLKRVCSRVHATGLAVPVAPRQMKNT